MGDNHCSHWTEMMGVGQSTDLEMEENNYGSAACSLSFCIFVPLLQLQYDCEGQVPLIQHRFCYVLFTTLEPHRSMRAASQRIKIERNTLLLGRTANTIVTSITGFLTISKVTAVHENFS
ncbi:hypothetical protein ILYODFUR_034924 [Ilyodon furcidens]|uniref:Uncharacterized protein n=1 Tax=Ilyodon furcidens TaxID=33524 RepID=A0ABV0VAG8_9TELE